MGGSGKDVEVQTGPTIKRRDKVSYVRRQNTLDTLLKVPSLVTGSHTRQTSSVVSRQTRSRRVLSFTQDGVVEETSTDGKGP